MATGRSLAVVILAAGQGKRMKSGLVKVLHELGGRPMLAYPIDAAEALAPSGWSSWSGATPSASRRPSPVAPPSSRRPNAAAPATP